MTSQNKFAIIVEGGTVQNVLALSPDILGTNYVIVDHDNAEQNGGGISSVWLEYVIEHDEDEERYKALLTQNYGPDPLTLSEIAQHMAEGQPIFKKVGKDWRKYWVTGIYTKLTAELAGATPGIHVVDAKGGTAAYSFDSDFYSHENV